MGKTNGAEQKTFHSAGKCDPELHFRTSPPRDRRTGSNHNQPTHYEMGCMCMGNHREPCKVRVAEETQNLQPSEPGHSAKRNKH